MKNHLLLPTLSVGLTLLFTPARAEDAVPTTLTPEMQELIAQLLKAAAESRRDPAPAAEPVPQPSAPKEAKAPAPAVAKSSLRTSGLTTGRLTTATLTPSAPLDGRGTTGGTPRFSAEEWRALFVSKSVRR